MPNRLQTAVLISAVLAGTSLPASAADLLSVYRDALNNDPSYQIAANQHDAAQQAMNIARAAKRPTVGLSAVARASDNSRLDETNLTAAITGSLPLYNRSNELNIDAARASAAEADADLTAAEQSLALQTAQLYFNVLRARDELAFARDELAAFERQLEQTDGRYEVGLVAITDVKEAQATFDSAQASVLVAENQLSTAMQALKVSTGTFPETFAFLRNNIELRSPQPADVDMWVARGIEQSPRLRAAQQQTQAARVDLGLADVTNSPTLDLEATISETLSDVDLNDNFGNRAIQLNFSMPLYSGGAIAASKTQSRLLLTAAEQQLELTTRELERDIRNNYASVESAISRVNALVRALESSSTGLEATQAGFDAGTRTNVDVLNAIRSESNAKAQLSSARYDYMLALMELYALVGELGESEIIEINAWLAE